MYEIELKAHVDDRDATIAKINTFATFCGKVEKSDTYYKLLQHDHKISTRIRSEKSNSGTKILLTYKRKEVRTDASGTKVEVNDEKECEISAAEPLEALLSDIGFTLSLKKEKSVLGWIYKDAHLELCTVPPLGDFLEIEIISPANDSQTLETCQQELQDILAKSGITKDKIEERYYSDMLRQANAAKAL